MTKVLPYKEGHLDFLDPLECYESSAKERIQNACMSPDYTAYTLVVDRLPIAVVGCVLMNPGVLSVWAVAGKEIMQYPVFYHKTLRNLINGHVDELRVHRVQSLIDADNERAFHQHLRLGFELEAKLERTGYNGQDQYLMRKFYDGYRSDDSGHRPTDI